MKKKLSLTELKVQSFVTQIEDSKNIQGGAGTIACSVEQSKCDACIPQSESRCIEVSMVFPCHNTEAPYMCAY